ncbi:MAG: glycosyltransferase family 2 protein [Bacillota bacterium]|nr:glycosyltransferase family 2 protein [Bacillota bacterium]
MKLQVLVAAVNQEVNSLAGQMNLESDAIIVNQCDHFDYCEYLHKDRLVKCFSMPERGVGLSRNTALMRADGDICLFSDEDIVFTPGYEKLVLDAFEANPDADIITFNFIVDPSRTTYCNKAPGRIRWYNYGRYPTYAVAAKTESLRRANVSFSLLFGGGARYSNGEDSLFLHDCLKKGLHLYASCENLGQEVYRESTWFKGYNEKFFVDRGVLYHYLYGVLARLFSLRFLYVHRKEMLGELGFREAYRLMKQGIGQGKDRI